MEPNESDSRPKPEAARKAPAAKAKKPSTPPEPITSFKAALECLSPRTRHVLSELGVTTLKGILALRPNDLWAGDSVPGGWQEIVLLKERILVSTKSGRGTAFRPTRWRRRPATPAMLAELPLFSSAKIPTLSPSQLHKTYLPGLALRKLLPRHDLSLMERKGLKTVGKLLLATPTGLYRVLKRSHIDPGVGELRAVVKNAIVGSADSPEFSSLAALFRSAVYGSVSHTMSADVFLEYTATKGRAVPAYADLGKRHGMSHQKAQRAVQLVRQALTKQLNSWPLRRFRSEVTEGLREKGGSLKLRRLAGMLKRRCRWAVEPSPEMLALVLQLNPQYEVDEGKGSVRLAADRGAPRRTAATKRRSSGRGQRKKS